MIEYILGFILATKTITVYTAPPEPQKIEVIQIENTEMTYLPIGEVKTPLRVASKLTVAIKDPMPYATTKLKDGKMVCARKNDKPSKSDIHNKKHLDMECCLDPDEIPNNNCYYGKKYQKLIDKYNKSIK